MSKRGKWYLLISSPYMHTLKCHTEPQIGIVGKFEYQRKEDEAVSNLVLKLIYLYICGVLVILREMSEVDCQSVTTIEAKTTVGR